MPEYHTSSAMLQGPVLKQVRGFTLIELLMVVSIIAVIAVVVLLVLNPLELFRQARDSNRLADMNTLRKAIVLYMADVKTVNLGTPTDFGASWCFATTSSAPAAGCGVFTASYNASTTRAASSTVRNINGTGWVPIAFSQISTKAPFSALPVDPINNATLYYAYAATSSSNGLFELTANFESAKYIPLEAKDGGASSTLYEIGTAFSL